MGISSSTYNQPIQQFDKKIIGLKSNSASPSDTFIIVNPNKQYYKPFILHLLQIHLLL